MDKIFNYEITNVQNEIGTTFTGWSINSDRTLNIPECTSAGTYYVTIKVTEGQTEQYNATFNTKIITVKVNKADRSGIVSCNNVM